MFAIKQLETKTLNETRKYWPVNKQKTQYNKLLSSDKDTNGMGKERSKKLDNSLVPTYIALPAYLDKIGKRICKVTWVHLGEFV